jgi:hypothetical protein
VLDASVLDGFAGTLDHDLNTAKLTGEYFYRRRIGGQVSYFITTGTSDATLYAPAPVTGSATGSPNSRGQSLEVDYLPWLNAKLQAQYVTYDKFNGGKSDYDGAGRSAANNNSLYILIWLNY